MALHDGVGRGRVEHDHGLGAPEEEADTEPAGRPARPVTRVTDVAVDERLAATGGASARGQRPRPVGDDDRRVAARLPERPQGARRERARPEGGHRERTVARARRQRDRAHRATARLEGGTQAHGEGLRPATIGARDHRQHVVASPAHRLVRRARIRPSQRRDARATERMCGLTRSATAGSTPARSATARSTTARSAPAWSTTAAAGGGDGSQNGGSRRARAAKKCASRRSRMKRPSSMPCRRARSSGTWASYHSRRPPRACRS